MTPLLSILIPTLPVREKLLRSLVLSLHEQLPDFAPVQLLINSNTSMQIGAKRNVMMAEARGEYVCFIDDDDSVSDNYLPLILAALERKPTHCSLIGEITTDGKDPKKFIHSIDYDQYFEYENVYYRHPNHLNCIRRDIANRIPFPDWKFSEDTNFAVNLLNSGLLTNEAKIHECIYFYNYISDKARHDYSK